MDIIKASGKKQKFSKRKLYQSLRRVGAKPKVAEKVYKEVFKGIRSGFGTEKIFNQALHRLQKENPI